MRAYVPLTTQDVNRLPDRYRLHVVQSETGFVRLEAMRRRCVALTEDKRCDIYEHRPDVCRRYERGGWQCRVARRQEGIT